MQKENRVIDAGFVKSCTTYKDCPEPRYPEYAFIGRSNVGKSSLINLITNRRNLARISSNPGKTQLINHFIIDNSWYLVDLPGYGYAKVSKKERVKWSGFIEEYIRNRENLYCLFVLIDSRIPPQSIDLEFIRKLGLWQIPFAIVFTKSDKLSANHLQQNISNFKKELLKEWEFLPQLFTSSAQTGLGKESILEYISELNGS